jgi:3-methyladenine DNA glycosylase/8-oxoguanine DNA glycosylase
MTTTKTRTTTKKTPGATTRKRTPRRTSAGTVSKPTAAELRALARRDRKLGALLAELPPFPGYPERRNERHRSHWTALAGAIVYQQLHGKAAATIFGRLCALTPGTRFPEPAELLALPDRALRAAGLSRQKLLALRDLAGRIEAGTLPIRRLSRLPEDEIVARLTEVRGIGDWSARMFLIFRLGRLDVMAQTDFGVQEGLRLLDGGERRPSPREALARAEAWRPLRTVGCWAMWRLVERSRARTRTGD